MRKQENDIIKALCYIIAEYEIKYMLNDILDNNSEKCDEFIYNALEKLNLPNNELEEVTEIILENINVVLMDMLDNKKLLTGGRCKSTKVEKRLITFSTV